MEKIRFWLFPAALVATWMIVSAYTLARVSEMAAQPAATFVAPEMVIEMGRPAWVFTEGTPEARRAERRRGGPAPVGPAATAAQARP